MSHLSDNLSAYLDGELEPSEVAELEAALADDEGLRRELAAIEAAIGIMRAHGPLEAPEGFAAAVLARVESEGAAPAGLLVWLRRPFGIPAEALALAAAALLVLVLAVRPAGPPDAAVADREVYAPEEPSAAAWAPAEEAEEEPAPVEQTVRPKAEKKMDAPTSSLLRPRSKPSPLPGKVATAKGETSDEAKGGAKILEGGGAALGTADDEATGEPSTGGMTRVPFSYTLSATDASVLKKLDVMVRRLGGRLETSRGEAFPVASMQPGTEQVFVRLPNTQLSTFGSELSRLGTVHLRDANEMVASSVVTLQIQVDYEPGTTTYEATTSDQ